MSKQGKNKPVRSRKQKLLTTMLTSIMGMILCTSMLLGTTMAWFTDTVHVTGNQINTGSLKVDLLYGSKLLKNTSEPIFGSDVTWKPAHMEIRDLTIVNNGTLNLRYVLNLMMEADENSIAQYFDVFVKRNGHANRANYATENAYKEAVLAHEDDWEEIGTLAEIFRTGRTVVEGCLEFDPQDKVEEKKFSIAIRMKQMSSDDTQGQSMSLGIKLDAYQEDIPDSEIGNLTTFVTADSSTALQDALTGEDTKLSVTLASNNEYVMPSISGKKTVYITGSKDAVLDITNGAYMEQSNVKIEGVTIKGSTGKVNGNGSDYAALYSPNVTYVNCTFDGPFRIGRDGATFKNCTFKNLGNDYVWTYGNDCTFENCTFETEGKAILIYSDGGNEVSKVNVTGCTFKATKGAKAGAIANQNCAAIEIDNYGCGVVLTTSGNTVDEDFSGEWRIKTYSEAKASVTVNDAEYKSIALDGKTMTIDADKNVTVKN